MIEHHQAELLIVAGKAALPSLKEIVHAFSHENRLGDPCCCGGPGGTYQWSKVQLTIADRNVTVLHIPHFSRANSQPIMDECAEWLRNHLITFGLTGSKGSPAPAPDVESAPL